MASKPTISPLTVDRGAGDLVLTVYMPVRRWYGRRRARWELAFQTPAFGGEGEYLYEIAKGWTQPDHYGVRTVRIPASATDWYS